MATVWPIAKRGEHMTRKELENVFWTATVMCLALDPASEDEFVQQRVRKSWPTTETGSTNWKRDENVVFLRITPWNDEIGRYADSSYYFDQDTQLYRERVDFTKSHQIHFLCYGPDSYDDAETIRIGILRANIRQFLQKNRLGIMPHIREPIQMSEQDETGEWWERYDLTVYCYENVTKDYEIGTIEVAPNVITI